MLKWHDVGAMPIRATPKSTNEKRLSPHDFLNMLSFVEHKFDHPYLSESRESDGGPSMLSPK